MINQRRIFSLVLSLSAIFAMACSPRFAVNTDREEGINLEAYQSFAFASNAEETQNYDPILNSSLNQKRIESLITEQLNNKGYNSQSGSPDFIVKFYTKVEDKQQVRSFNTGPGFYWWYSPFQLQNNNVYTRNYEEGTLIIDVIDAQTNRLIWQGWAVGEIDYTSEKYKEKLAEKVRQIFSRFPDRVTSTGGEV